MNKYFYSPGTRGFYQSDIHSIIPDDAIEISAEEYHQLANDQQNGMEITPGAGGRPVLTEPVIDYVAQAQQVKNSLRLTADAEISWRQDAVDAGIATAGETAALAEWKKYRVLLMRVDTSKAPAIEWPTPPDAQAI
ncbi:tail fiber assembly protein [Enterobacter roggenkampii]|nr:tail fiber assembly protein [Enterobacter roggenkampii]ELW9297461.1 tail fiber assembly protein [Enterobacter roggenkampii]EMF0889774.1 tail fiber assembly protein [Enterobacter roggenkampii]MCC1990503.1 tail fiber assembly protein [Enterobacter roggenkampii]MCK6875574.1 tail fiber assembly protein [Enterobacter roggenkampii]HCM9149618.1 tail fiber assembly protein [Enterobacter roggenkampii]